MHEAIATQLAMFTRQHGNMSRVPFNTVFFFSPFFSASFSTAVHMYGGYGTPKWVEKRKNVEQSKHLGRYGGGVNLQRNVAIRERTCTFFVTLYHEIQKCLENT